MQYSEKIYQTKRRKTREVKVGSVGIGSFHPIRIQSMTTSKTDEVEKTIDQILRLADSGCDLVRVTVQGKKEAAACEKIKNGLLQRGYQIPLVADIHFYPPAAMEVVEFVDKIRINPGNFVDKRASFKKLLYEDEASYKQELDKILEVFSPLVEKCKRLGKAMRIGVNHGSLSDRIMSRYGDTSAGMVESALEFARICNQMDYHNFLFSMKASNPLVMIEAYRLLSAKMYEINWDYPLHLGVTEAGLGIEGRVKSAIGIGALLLDGLGDTIRVSLTEDPWQEIPPCQALISFFDEYKRNVNSLSSEKTRSFLEIDKRETYPQSSATTVYLRVTEEEILEADFFEAIGARVDLGALKKEIGSIDALIIPHQLSQGALEKIAIIKSSGILVVEEGVLPFVQASDETNWPLVFQKDLPVAGVKFGSYQMQQGRRLAEFLQKESIKTPLILSFSYDCSFELAVIRASSEIGSLLVDKIGEGICIEGPYSVRERVELMLLILQGCRRRSFKTDYIACPGCGRTLFDLQEVTQDIQKKTAHLPGVKIAVMGCIVNGPGEMADADFGYVGSKPGFIDLYVGKQCVEKNILTEKACDRLIDLIKAHGCWTEP